jgi:hypothetical protein
MFSIINGAKSDLISKIVQPIYITKSEVVIPAEPAPVMDCRGIAGIQVPWMV